jgi:dipeptidyl aminopeptidase/acylaminoacyl peptidase
MRRFMLMAAVAAASSGSPATRAATPAAAAADGALTIEKLLDIKHPSTPIWSPDGRHVAFVWERTGVQNLYVSDVGSGDAAAAPRALTTFPAGEIGGHFWSRDNAAVFFGRGGDLWRAPLDGTAAAPVWTTKGNEAQIVPSPDRTRVAFVREGDIWVRSLADGAETRITSTPDVGEGGPTWSPDGSKLAFSSGKVARKEYAPEYSGAKILYTVTERTPLDIQVAPAAGGTAITIAPNPAVERAARWLDPSHLVFERVSQDTTTREIVIADTTSGEGRVLVREEDKKWWSVTPSAQPGPQPSPDGHWIAFISDRDGWDRVYVVAATGTAAEPVAVSPAGRESWRHSWSPDGTHLVFDGNSPETPGVRQLFTVAIANGRASGAPVALTSGRGTNIAASWSPDGHAVVYQHTDPHNSADLFVARTNAGAGAAAGASAAANAKAPAPAPLRLSDSLQPAGIDRTKLIEPTLVSYPSSDGQKVPAYLFLPPNFDKTKKYPAVVWIHGDGVNQNYDGWHVERNYAVYYSFHQYLLQQGYVVLTPDYRGSIGYGKAWRQGVYLDVGGKDYEDAELGARYLKTLGYVDGERLGVWGLSYGGFFTLQAITQAPRDFAAAVDVAGVADYAMYYEDPWKGAWTYGRMRAPEDHPTQYAGASPLSHMDRLERPLLILHGTADVNVPYLHSIRLVDTLLKLKKEYEFVTYPGEFHYFTREHVLRDAWTKVDRFFGRYLKPPMPAPSAP